MSEEKKSTSWVVYAMLLVLGIYIGTKIPHNSLVDVSNKRVETFIDIINKNYVDTVNITKIEDAAIAGMLANLDPHSLFVPASDLQSVKEDLQSSFEGIGIQFRSIEDTVTVITPIAGGPSQKVGIKAGDKIVEVEGDAIAGKKLTNEEIIKKLKGPKGSMVKLGILRYGLKKPLQITVTRDVIPTYSVDAYFMEKPNLAYIKVSRFAESTAKEFKKALSELDTKGMKKLILDLRSNGGGYLGAAVEMIDMFLPKNSMIVYTEGLHRKKTEIEATGKGPYQNIELVVLMDEWSASASEIIAGAVQDNDRGFIVGRRSFGKGLVQEQIEMNDGSALRLTVSRYYTPSGRCIQKPYQSGSMEDYEEELLRRYSSGEVLGTDSSLHTDTTKYYTKKGRVVYGGGGIQPDKFVPYKTDKDFIYLNMLNQKGLYYQFTFSYVNKRRDALQKAYPDAEIFTRKFQVDEALYSEFLAYVKKNEVQLPSIIEQKYESRIKTLLKAYIARDIFEENGFYQSYLNIDDDFQEAIKL